MTASAISSLSGFDAASSTSQKEDRGSLGKDDFLRLLMAQLGNQDPTSPQDTEQFMNQLTQFSSLEQLQNANARLETLLVSATSQSQLAATNMIGKEVLLRTDQLEHTAGQADRLGVQVAPGATDAKVVIKDKNGTVLRTLPVSNPGTGGADLTWDGLDQDGNPVPSGTYTITATATDISGTSVSAEVHRRGHVDGISYANGFAELLIGDLRVKMSDVVEVTEPA